MSILVEDTREVFFSRKTAVNYGTVKRQAGAEVLSFEVSSLEGFFFRSTTVDISNCLYMYRCNII